MTNPATDSRVALAKCATYDVSAVEASVRRAVETLGGMPRFVQSGQRVLVKPNLVLPSDPARAIITHPAVVRAVVRLAQEAGGRVLIADNPTVVPVTQQLWQAAYQRAGLAAVAAETGAELNTHIVHEQCPHPDGRLIKMVDTSSFVTEADVIISLPKLKTHGFMRYTGAVKNLFGIVPAATKFGYHLKLQQDAQFADMLLDLASFVRPALTLMDAIVAMDGAGPSAGDPFPIGAIMASADPTALDVAAVALIGHEPRAVPTVAAAIRRGWTTGRLADLEMVGDDVADVQVTGFRLPPGAGSQVDVLPPPLRRFAARLLVANPHVTARCVGCGLCIENCPAETIRWMQGSAQIELGGCIRCYCCHELCPEQAIDLRAPWVGRALARVVR
jgi:uncharacterized protein (DUF362 family)/NAD-dependent dihydropyrimidine dehydrogenase PreA subunit